MLFNSFEYFFFVPIVFFLYWIVAKGHSASQNFILFLASYFFYGCWDYRFLILLMFSTLLDYFTGFKIYKANSIRQKKFWLFLSVLINLGFLGIFKYYNFFAGSLLQLFTSIGVDISIQTLELILPVGISFYTFHGLSYVLDLYKEKIQPERNVLNYAVFVSFFPLLVAGPIERATHLLPQIKGKRFFNYSLARDGLRQILWGVFKKIVIADRCAMLVNYSFNDPSSYSGVQLVLYAVFFTIQIYCDFSGYSDIAIGTGKLFGIQLLRNFNYPFFSRSIPEFWRRWHISLTSWFRDYVYIPLGGSKGHRLFVIRNVFVIFLLSGLWHGANWTFLIWGLLNALYMLPSLLNKKQSDTKYKQASYKDLPSIAVTFFLTVFAFVFFRAQSISDAFIYFKYIISNEFWVKWSDLPNVTILLTLIFLLIEWNSKNKQHPFEDIEQIIPNTLKRWVLYGIILLIMFFYMGNTHEFIYFQF